MEHLNVSAPVEWRNKYIDLVMKYHDVCSKVKFDLGRTDVVEHKVAMKSEEPIHSRQFRIPLEHRQTIYDWVDELLKKGAIEVSKSRFNSPIFLVPKPHGHGMRAVLDFRAVNLNSVPDRYTIREVRDCVDEVGLLGSKVFSTIALTSGFWQQSWKNLVDNILLLRYRARVPGPVSVDSDSNGSAGITYQFCETD